MLTTMHSELRDRYVVKALVLDVVIMTGSLAVCILSVSRSDVLRMVGIADPNATWGISIAGAVVLLAAFIGYKVDWKGRSVDHDRAACVYSRFKLVCRTALCTDEGVTPEVFSDLARDWENLHDASVSVPESWFNRLKAVHYRKVSLSRALSQRPHASLWVLRIQLWWKDTFFPSEAQDASGSDSG